MYKSCVIFRPILKVCSITYFNKYTTDSQKVNIEYLKSGGNGEYSVTTSK